MNVLLLLCYGGWGGRIVILLKDHIIIIIFFCYGDQIRMDSFAKIPRLTQGQWNFVYAAVFLKNMCI